MLHTPLSLTHYPSATSLTTPQVGYLSFLKLGPKLLKWVPGQKAADLRTWLTAYAYWNQVRAGEAVGSPQSLAAYSVPHVKHLRQGPPASQ